MYSNMIIEMVGYFGSLLVVISMLMTSVMKLRVINTIGSTIFTVYALIIHSYPTAVMNMALIIINIINMRKLLATTDNYTMVKASVTDVYAVRFIEKYLKDIKNYFPYFNGITEENAIYLLMNGDTTVGITAGVEKDDILDISIDYTTPAYRDCSVGNAFYKDLKDFGMKKVVFGKKAVNHEEYLLKVGFVKEGEIYTKQL